MKNSFLAVALAVGTAVLAQNSTVAGTEAALTRSIEFPSLGPVFIKTVRPFNGFPAITFTSRAGELLLRTRIGTGDSTFRINPEENRDGRENPTLRYLVVDGPVSNSPVIFAAAMYGGGSDCQYKATVIGAHNGQLRSYLPRQAFANAEGGMYVGDLGDKRGYGFAVWNFIWGSEGHADPHRYNVKLFRFDPVAGVMLRIADLDTTRSYGTDEEALAEFNLHFPNLLRSISDFGC